MRVDISNWQLENVVKTPGGLRTRMGIQSVKTPTTNTTFVAGFSVESPHTTEVWHYLFEQDSGGGVTLRVFTEEFSELFSAFLGAMPKDPVITYGVISNQLMINSPSFSAPLYGLVGGGVITAVKTASVNPDTTALDIPAGHICTFGDRFCIAQGPVVFFNDPGTDPRTFVAENVVSLPGSVFDMFQGEGGGLYFFTSAGLYVMTADALGQGQAVVGSISRVPGIPLCQRD